MPASVFQAGCATSIARPRIANAARDIWDGWLKHTPSERPPEQELVFSLVPAAHVKREKLFERESHGTCGTQGAR